MKPSMYKRLFFPTLLSYVVLCFLLAISQGEGKTSFEIYCGIFGGISAGNLSGNLTKLMQWLLSFLPLLIFLGIQLSEELSGRLYITIIRSRSISHWWNSWVALVLLTAVMFSVAVFMSGLLASIVLGETRGFVPEYSSFICVFFINVIYNIMMSLFLLCFAVWLKSLKWSMVILMIIVFGSYVLGKFTPWLNPYLFGTYSMANRLQINDKVYGFNAAVAIILMLLLIIMAYCIGIFRAKKALYKIND